MKKYNKLLWCSSFLFIFFSIFFVMANAWIISQFGEIPFSQIIFQFLVPIEGADRIIIGDFIIKCLYTPLMMSIMIIGIVSCLNYASLQTEIAYKNDTAMYTIRATTIIQGLFVLISMSTCYNFFQFAANELGLYDYIAYTKSESTIFDDYFVDPNEITFTYPEEKRNLIYIYLESMESTYQAMNENGSTVDLIPELTYLADTNLTFDGGSFDRRGFFVPEGATWTIGAMVAQTAGIPLKIPVGSNDYGGFKHFLPGATTLGDILDDADYRQYLMIGSEAVFGGRKNYFEQHGDYEIFDYFTAKERNYIPDNYMEWWGFEDEKLFAYAKSELLEITKHEEPFNFTMLSADTHFFDGYLSSSCNTPYNEQYSNVIACSSAQVYDFIYWIQQQAFYDNTTIVIAGDHLSMDNDYFLALDDHAIRKGFYTIINSSLDYTNGARDVTSFDLFPTTLASLGITFDQNRLGIGTNLFSDEPTLLELLGWDTLQEQLYMNSKYYNNQIIYAKE